MAMVPLVVAYNTGAGSNNILTVPAGKVFIVTWSSYLLQNALILGAFSGRLITAGDYIHSRLFRQRGMLALEKLLSLAG